MIDLVACVELREIFRQYTWNEESKYVGDEDDHPVRVYTVGVRSCVAAAFLRLFIVLEASENNNRARHNLTAAKKEIKKKKEKKKRNAYRIFVGGRLIYLRAKGTVKRASML